MAAAEPKCSRRFVGRYDADSGERPTFLGHNTLKTWVRPTYTAALTHYTAVLTDLPCNILPEHSIASPHLNL